MSPVKKTGDLGIDKVKARALILTWIRMSREKRRRMR